MIERIAENRPASLFIQALDEVIKREHMEAAKVRTEIEQNGGYWAADEIWRLRRHVAALEKRLANKEQENS